MGEKIIPKIKKSINDFLFDEEGNITRNKILTVGSMMLIMSFVLATDALAAHRSHSSHKSHSSHSSHKSHSSGSGGHYSHVSHVSHSSHSSSSGGYHSSHSSSSGGGTYYSTPVTHSNLPSMANVKLPSVPSTASVFAPTEIKTTFALPDTPKIK